MKNQNLFSESNLLMNLTREGFYTGHFSQESSQCIKALDLMRIALEPGCHLFAQAVFFRRDMAKFSAFKVPISNS